MSVHANCCTLCGQGAAVGVCTSQGAAVGACTSLELHAAALHCAIESVARWSSEHHAHCLMLSLPCIDWWRVHTLYTCLILSCNQQCAAAPDKVLATHADQHTRAMAIIDMHAHSSNRCARHVKWVRKHSTERAVRGYAQVSISRCLGSFHASHICCLTQAHQSAVLQLL